MTDMKAESSISLATSAYRLAAEGTQLRAVAIVG
jgi:hypothetical protein